MSDVHIVLSQDVPPSIPDKVWAYIPSPSPTTVTAADPVPAKFTARTTLTPMPAYDAPWDTLPPLCPTLTDVLLLPCSPGPCLQASVVSDIQPVSSHPLSPTRTLDELATVPKLPPSTLTLAEPVDALLARIIRLASPACTDKAVLALPTPPTPTVIDKGRLEPSEDPTTHTTDVSESHLVRSHFECPTLAAPVNAASPAPTPHTVTLVDPVAPVFVALPGMP